MPEFVEPDKIDNDAPATDTEPTTEQDLPTVTIDGEEVPFTVAVESMASMMDNPEAFGLTTEGDHIETQNEIKELRDRVEQQEEAIAELASAVELLSENQPDALGINSPATVQLEPLKFGDIYTTTAYDLDSV
jgi:hypothetical protein